MNLNQIEVDEQHQQLITMLEGVKYAIEEHVPQSELNQLANTLHSSFIAHFCAKERFYQEYYDPQSEAHRQDHRYMLNNISDLKKSLASCSWQIALELTDTIKYAFLSQVTDFDDRFAPDIEY